MKASVQQLIILVNELRQATENPPFQWRFQNLIRLENIEQFKAKAKVNAYEELGFSSDKAIHLPPMMICLLSAKDSDKITPNF